MTIDTHQHFWRCTSDEFGWISDDMAAICRDYLPADLRSQLAEQNVNGVVAVQARQSIEETRWELDGYFDIVLEAFGPQRLMFGSNWPVSEACGGYDTWIAAVRGWAQKLTAGERDRLFGTTAVEAYKLPESQ